MIQASDFDYKLLKGSHEFPGPAGGACLNEVAIVAAGLDYRAIRRAEDCPLCFSRPIAAFVIVINDHADDLERQQLKRFVLRLAGSGARLQQVEAENEDLRDRLEYLESEVFGDCLQFPAAWRLARRERRILGALLSLNVADRAALLTAVYRGGLDEECEPASLDSYIHHLRGKLAPFGIEIHCKRNVGWWIDQPRRNELRQALRLTQPPWRQLPCDRALIARVAAE